MARRIRRWPTWYTSQRVFSAALPRQIRKAAHAHHERGAVARRCPTRTCPKPTTKPWAFVAALAAISLDRLLRSRLLGRRTSARARGADAASRICPKPRPRHLRRAAAITSASSPPLTLRLLSRAARNHAVELRREILDCLVDLGATDGELTLAETNLLRRTTNALGLEANDYVVSQQRHRDKLK